MQPKKGEENMKTISILTHKTNKFVIQHRSVITMGIMAVMTLWSEDAAAVADGAILKEQVTKLTGFIQGPVASVLGVGGVVSAVYQATKENASSVKALGGAGIALVGAYLGFEGVKSIFPICL